MVPFPPLSFADHIIFEVIPEIAGFGAGFAVIYFVFYKREVSKQITAIKNEEARMRVMVEEMLKRVALVSILVYVAVPGVLILGSLFFMSIFFFGGIFLSFVLSGTILLLLHVNTTLDDTSLTSSAKARRIVIDLFIGFIFLLLINSELTEILV